MSPECDSLPGWSVLGQEAGLLPQPKLSSTFQLAARSVQLSSTNRWQAGLLTSYLQQALPLFHQLTKLDLTGLPYITASALRHIPASCAHLRSLLLPRPILDEDVLDVPPSHDWRPLPADLASLLTAGTGLPHLERLTCQQWHPTSQQLAPLSSLPRLAALTFGADSSHVCPAPPASLPVSLTLLSGLTELRVLVVLAKYGLLPALPHLPRLRHLQLSHDGDFTIADAHVAALQRLTALTCLELGLEPVWRPEDLFSSAYFTFNLFYNGPTQWGLAFDSFQHLRRLRIGEALTTACVKRLARLPVLEDLEVLAMHVGSAPACALPTVTRLTCDSVFWAVVSLESLFPSLTRLTVRDLSENMMDGDEPHDAALAEDAELRLVPTYATLLSRLPAGLSTVRVAVNKDGSTSCEPRRASMQLPLAFILRHLFSAATDVAIHAHRTRDAVHVWGGLPALPVLQVLDLCSHHLEVLTHLLRGALDAAPGLRRLTLRGGGHADEDDSDDFLDMMGMMWSTPRLPRLRYVELGGFIADELCRYGDGALRQLCGKTAVEEVVLHTSLAGIDAFLAAVRSRLCSAKPALSITGVHMEQDERWSGQLMSI